MQVDIREAEERLYELIDMIEKGEEEKIVITRRGKAVAEIVPYEVDVILRKIGDAQGKLRTHLDINRYNEEIARIFGEDV